MKTFIHNSTQYYNDAEVWDQLPLTVKSNPAEAPLYSQLNFSSTHPESIKSHPSFRHAFQQMCSSIGVDPLACLGMADGGLRCFDWQYELEVQLVDVCVSIWQSRE
jgi:hypothetical protein